MLGQLLCVCRGIMHGVAVGGGWGEELKRARSEDAMKVSYSNMERHLRIHRM